MIVKNKIHDKTFKSKLHDIYNTLDKMIKEHEISDIQKYLLSDRLNECRCNNESSAFYTNTENVDNSKSQLSKTLESALKSKDEKIANLENIINDLKSGCGECQVDSKRIKIDENSVLEEYATKLEADIKDLKEKICSLNTKSQDEEIKLKNEIAKLEILIANLERKNHEAKKTLDSPQSIDVINALDTISKLNDEIQSYRDKILTLRKQIAVNEKAQKGVIEENLSLKNTVEVLNTNSFIRDIPDELLKTSVERFLKEELDSIVKAFNQVSKLNQELQEKHSVLNNKNNILFDENATLKNKIKEFEDSKVLVEKEKKRLDQMKKEIIEQNKNLKSRECLFDKQIEEKNKILEDFKEKFSKIDVDLKISKKESENYKLGIKKLQNELIETNKSKTEIELNYKRQSELLSKYQTAFNADSKYSLSKDLETYKRALTCPLCDLNLRNCTLVKCMHVFCEECVISRFKARNRKCPTCEMEFNTNDIKKLYF